MTTKSPFSRMFGRSPFKPMQAHMKVVARCAGEVPDMFDALCDGDHDKVVAIKERIFEMESEADAIKNELRAHLPKSLMMPVNRADLLNILEVQDRIADTAQDLAGMLTVRRMEVPKTMCELLMAFTRRCADACTQAARIIGELDELVETGFRGRESELVGEMVDELSKIETDTDRMAFDLLQELFASEDKMGPVSVVFWYQLIKQIGNLADYTEMVGNRLRLLLAR